MVLLSVCTVDGALFKKAEARVELFRLAIEETSDASYWPREQWSRVLQDDKLTEAFWKAIEAPKQAISWAPPASKKKAKKKQKAKQRARTDKEELEALRKQVEELRALPGLDKLYSITVQIATSGNFTPRELRGLNAWREVSGIDAATHARVLKDLGLSERSLEERAEQVLCVVCQDAETCNMVPAPCGHACFCEACVARLNGQRCPICRKTIERFIRKTIERSVAFHASCVVSRSSKLRCLLRSVAIRAGSTSGSAGICSSVGALWDHVKACGDRKSQ